MISCIAIDDEPLALEVIEQFCSRVPFLELKKTFTRPTEAGDYLKKFPVDLLFLDIQMPDINGMDFLKSVHVRPLVILTTAHAEFAVEGFNINAVDFLLKPILFKRFEEAALKAKEQYEHQLQAKENDQRNLFVRSEYALVKIPVSDILYIETMDDYLKIHQIGKKPVLTISSIKKILEKLPAEDFVRVHRSIVVSINRIESVRGKVITMGSTEIPLSKNYEKEFFQAYMKDRF